MTRRLRCGFAAILDPARSMHTQTVLRALDIYKALFAHDTLEFICCEDFGSVEGGAHAADFLVSRGVDLVVGHYASNSAMGAAPFYAEHGVALLLPTATDTGLTRGRDNVFRVCANNDEIVRAVLSLLPPGETLHLKVVGDGSAYGHNLAAAFNDAVPAVEQGAETITVFIGTGTRSEQFLQASEHSNGRGDFILTDDAACEHLAIPGSMRVGQVRAVGFAPVNLANPTAPCVREYERRYGETPGVFFLETIGALEIASQLQATSRHYLTDLNSGSFATSLGELRFVLGERQQGTLCLWSNDEDNTLRPVRLIKTNRESLI